MSVTYRGPKVLPKVLKALKEAQEEKIAWGEIETEPVGYLGSQDTFYVGTIKGVGRIYQQTFVETYLAVACAKLYTIKHPINSADFLNDRVIPFFDQHQVLLLRMLTDRWTEFCGKPDTHEYQLFLALNDIDHSRTKAKNPQANGICGRFQRTVLDEFYRIAFRKKIYLTLEELQKDFDEWIDDYNIKRPHQGKRCQGKTMATFLENVPLAKEKILDMKDDKLTLAA